MTSIVGVYAMRGCVSTCNARCYNAKQPSSLREPRRNACICICGGANHGMGLAHAIRNAQRNVGLSEQALQAFADERGLAREGLVVIDRLRVRSDIRARRLSRELLDPPQYLPGEDLFACEEVSP